MSHTLDQDRHEFDELCENNPNYPKDFELHRMYQSHIKKWKPLIESNDPLIYSEWSGFNEQHGKWDDLHGDVYDEDWYRLHFILDNQIVKQSPFSTQDLSYGLRIIVARDRAEDVETRRDLIKLVFTSYVDCIEHRFCDKHYGHYDACIHKTGLKKNDLIRFMERLNATDTNPFDLLSYFYGQRYLNDRKKNRVVESIKRELYDTTTKEHDVSALPARQNSIADAELGLTTLLVEWQDHIPSHILQSKFAKMDEAQIVDYAGINEQQRREVQRFLKAVYDWSLDWDNSYSFFAWVWRRNYKRRLEQGYSEDQMYDWYYNNSPRVDDIVLLRRVLILITFIGLLWLAFS